MRDEEEKYDLESIAGIVDHEGLDYAITDYLNPDHVPEPLEDPWRKARKALREIEDILAPYMP